MEVRQLSVSTRSRLPTLTFREVVSGNRFDGLCDYCVGRVNYSIPSRSFASRLNPASCWPL